MSDKKETTPGLYKIVSFDLKRSERNKVLSGAAVEKGPVEHEKPEMTVIIPLEGEREKRQAENVPEVS